MPKISQIKSSLHGSPHYEPLTPTAHHRNSTRKATRHLPHHSSKYSSPVIEVKCTHRSHNLEQNMIWYDEAVRRASGRSTLQRPKIDRLQCQGRTIYDVQYTSLKPKREGTRQPYAYPPTPTSPPVQDPSRRRKTSRSIPVRRRSLIDETLTQAENGKALRKLSPLFALDIFTVDLDEDVKPSAQDLERGISVRTPPQDERRLSMPSLTWSESPGDGSDAEDVILDLALERKLASEPAKQPLIVDSLPGDFQSFTPEYMINPLEPLGHMYDPWVPTDEPSRNDLWSGSPEFAETANEFFEMFVNTEDCEDISDIGC